MLSGIAARIDDAGRNEVIRPIKDCDITIQEDLLSRGGVASI